MRELGILFCTIWAFTLSGQITFTEERFTDDFFGLVQHCVVDMNGDHKDDIVGVSVFRMDIAYQTENGFDKQAFFETYNLPLWSISAGDIDGDGFNDLCLGSQDKVSFLYAEGNGTKYEESVQPDPIFCQRTNFIDIDNDGHTDVFVSNDVGQNHPYRNDGNGELTMDLSLIETPSDLLGNYTSTWVDYDNDGDVDMYMTKCVLSNQDPENPSLINQLYNNDGNGNFTDVAEAAGMDDEAQSWVSVWEDFDLDGDFDAFITNHNQSHRLMRNNGDGTFTDVIDNSGISKTAVLTSQVFSADFDNDGDMDIMIDEPNVIYYNNGDLTFLSEPIEVSLGAIGDLNSDGFLDMQFSNRVYYNSGNDNHWLRVNPVGRSSNRNGIAARMELYGAWGMQIQEVRSGRSWSPMSTLSLHFGIGQYTAIDSLVIKWPSGMKTVVENPAIDQALTVDEWGCPVGQLALGINGSTTLCSGETVTLTAPDGFLYSWSTGESTQNITVSTTGYYNVELINPDTGCNQFSENIYVKNEGDPLELIAPDGDTFCQGTPVRLEVDSDGDILWSTGETTGTIWVFEPGDYFANVTNNCGESIQTFPITLTEVISENPIIEDTYVSSGGSVSLTADGPGDLLWFDVPIDGELLRRGDLVLTNVAADAVYYVERWITLPGGRNCVSQRVPVYVYLITSTTDNVEPELSLYPNPASYNLRVSSTDEMMDGYKIMDLRGRVLSSSAILPGKDLRVSVEDLSEGLYFIQLSVGGQLVTRQFTIIR